MANHGNRLAGILDFAHELARMRAHADLVGIEDAARQHDRIEVIGIGFRQCQRDIELIGFFSMMKTLHLAALDGKDFRIRASLLQCFQRARELNLFKAIVD